MSLIRCKIFARFDFPYVGEQSEFEENQIAWDPSQKAFVNGRRDPEILIVSTHKMTTMAERIDMLGYWILDKKSRIYHRQFVDQDMTNIIFVNKPRCSPSHARCNTKGKVGDISLEFQQTNVKIAKVIDWCCEIMGDQKRQISKLTERFDILKNAVENLSYLPGMEGYLEAESHFETRVSKEQLVDNEEVIDFSSLFV